MMVGVASQVEMRAHHIQIWPPSCRSTPLERPGGSGNEVVGNGSMLLNFVEPIKLQRFVTYTFQRYGPSANCISSIPIANHTQSVIGRYFQVSVRPRWSYGSCVRKTTVGYLTLCRSQHKPRRHFPRVV